MWGLTFDRIGFTTTGTQAGTFTFVSPDYDGEIPASTFRSPTNGVWIVGRISVINQNETDTAIVDDLLTQFTVNQNASGSRLKPHYVKAVDHS